MQSLAVLGDKATGQIDGFVVDDVHVDGALALSKDTEVDKLVGFSSAISEVLVEFSIRISVLSRHQAQIVGTGWKAESKPEILSSAHFDVLLLRALVDLVPGYLPDAHITDG